MLYKGWLIEDRTRPIEEPILVTVCGLLKIRVYHPRDSSSRSSYRSYDEIMSKPFSLDQQMLQGKVEAFTSDIDDFLIENLDAHDRSEIEDLLDQRNRRASNLYGWQLGAVVDISKGHNQHQDSSKFAIWKRKSKNSSKTGDKSKSIWLVIIRGGQLDSLPAQKAVPDIMSNPWQEVEASSSSRAHSKAIVKRFPQPRFSPQPGLTGLGGAALAAESYRKEYFEKEEKDVVKELAHREKLEEKQILEREKKERVLKEREMMEREMMEREMMERVKKEREMKHESKPEKDSNIADEEKQLRHNVGPDRARPTYTRMSRRHVSIEALNHYGIDYQLDEVSRPTRSYGQTLTRDRTPTTCSSKDGFPHRNKTSYGLIQKNSDSDESSPLGV
jgi:hypothetical protein